ETPIRTGHFRQMLAAVRRNGAQTASAVAVVGVLGLAACSLVVADPHCVGAQNCAQARNDAENAGGTTVPTTEPSTVPGDTTPGATTSTSTTVPKVPQRYVAIGDSVMVGAEPLLSAAGVFVFAKENRGTEGVKNSVIKLRDEGEIGAGTMVVIQVGHNAQLTEANVAAIVAEIPADVRAVYFMTVHGPVSGAAESNALLRSLPATNPRVTGVIDWDSIAGGLELCSDGIHISCGDAATPYANLILQTVGLPAIA
ncbi:MAG: hypothetical protein Q7V88_00705, partial [Actinomycetota bacterium]|nr:hypothetical protein [Actinomycetota bacterium]